LPITTGRACRGVARTGRVSNHTFLYSTQKPTKPLYGECPEKGRVLMAAVSIPVFWYMLFDEDCLAPGAEPRDVGKTYLHLTTRTAKGLALARKRWRGVAPLVGRHLDTLFKTWAAFVREKSDTHIHCETYEWFWMFETHDKFETELRTCLAAFHHIPKREGKDLNLTPEWDKLLGQAHVGRVGYGSRKGELEPLGNLSYCGFGYHFEVPWSEDHNMVCGVMSEKFREKVVYGTRPEALRGYLKDVWGPVHAVRSSRCRCGNHTFRLQAAPGHGARRDCTKCGTEYHITNSEEFWYEAKPKTWKCKKCKGSAANLAVGFEMDESEEMVQYVHVGARCVKCGRLDHPVSWEEYNGREIMNRA
jgi:hypothetical protein